MCGHPADKPGSGGPLLSLLTRQIEASAVPRLLKTCPRQPQCQQCSLPPEPNSRLLFSAHSPHLFLFLHGPGAGTDVLCRAPRLIFTTLPNPEVCLKLLAKGWRGWAAALAEERDALELMRLLKTSGARVLPEVWHSIALRCVSATAAAPGGSSGA